MNDFAKFNKVNGVYWLKKPIDILTIKIKIKQQDGVIQLPRFEQYNRLDTTNKDLNASKQDETIFKWQEKVFSRFEIEKYSNVHNCVTDNELTYFELLENTQYKGNKIFTYINEDYHRPLPLISRKENQSFIPYLNSCFTKLNLTANDKLRKDDGSSSIVHLFRSSEDISLKTERWMSMHVMYDNSEYTEDSQLLLKQESTLLSVYYNATKNYLIFSPNVNDLIFNPYIIEGDESRQQYSIEIDYGEENNSDELAKMLYKLYKKWEKKHKQLINFISPQLGKKMIYMTFEIVSASNFETDSIYVEFHTKIPEDIQCNGTLHGKTHSTCALKTEDLVQWKYGHTIDLEMEISTGIVPSPIKFYLEVISTDWWGRHRTEGYTYLQIPLDPGWHSKTLSCMRPEELDTVEAESRRFFVGGCHLIKDLGVLDNPLQSANYRWRSAGSVHVRWSTLVQSAGRGAVPSEGGADAALRRYRRAVAALAAARELYTREPDE